MSSAKSFDTGVEVAIDSGAGTSADPAIMAMTLDDSGAVGRKSFDLGIFLAFVGAGTADDPAVQVVAVDGAGGVTLPIQLPAGGPYVFQVDTSGNISGRSLAINGAVNTIDASGQVYYGGTNNVAIDSGGRLKYSGITGALADSSGTIYYGDGAAKLSDASRRLYYGNSDLLANENGSLYAGGQVLFVDSSGNIYFHDGSTKFVDPNGIISNRVGGIIVDASGNIKHPNNSDTIFPANAAEMNWPNGQKFIDSSRLMYGLDQLPTSDPHNNGQAYNLAGVLMISAG